LKYFMNIEVCFKDGYSVRLNTLKEKNSRARSPVRIGC
jgi:hypothetical protein